MHETSGVSEKAPEEQVFSEAPQAAAASVALVATQLAEFPPFTPKQVHEVEPPCEGKLGDDGLAVPTEQNEPKKDVSVAKYPFAAGPQTPSCFKLALQVAVEPVQEPAQLQDQGPVPETELGEPEPHKPELGAE